MGRRDNACTVRCMDYDAAANQSGLPGCSGAAAQTTEFAETTDPEEMWHIKRRIAELTPMLTQVNELAELTEHYYERGYRRNEKYTV